MIEPYLDVIAASDWIVELRPEGGDTGGILLLLSHQSKFKHTFQVILENTSNPNWY